MILKKPYGLLIKYFKLIHIVLSILSIYVIFKTKDIVSFFRSYVANDYSATITEHMSRNYISPFLFVALILLIAIVIVVFILLKYKKKPTKLYIISLVYYILLLLMMIISVYLLNSLEVSLWSTTSARLYRDISQIIFLPQILIIIILGVRSLGFNIKQFNFQNDLRELELVKEDSEEVEINLNFDPYKTKRTFRRLMRELKYYIKENTFVFICIIVLITGGLIYLVFKNYEVFQVKYNQNETFMYESLGVKIEDSIITNLNYAGEVINPDKLYLLIKVNFSNQTKNNIKPDIAKYKLKIGDKFINPSIDEGSNFIDYALPYKEETIKGKTNGTYLLTYVIDTKDINEDTSLIMYTGISLKRKVYKPKTIKVKINPVKIREVNIVKNTSLNDTINLSGTYLGNTTINIRNAEITHKYQYNYEHCQNGKCNTYIDFVTPDITTSNKKVLIVFDYNFSLDQESSYARTSKSFENFASNFFKIRYKHGINTYITTIKNVTPVNIKDKLVVEVNEGVTTASRIELLMTIRNKCYVINLVG